MYPASFSSFAKFLIIFLSLAGPALVENPQERPDVDPLTSVCVDVTGFLFSGSVRLRHFLSPYSKNVHFFREL